MPPFRKALKTWVRDVLVLEQTDEDNPKRCTALSLVHYNGLNKVEVKTIRIGSKPVDPTELAKLFEETANTHAGGLDAGRQQYEVLAFFNDSEEPQERYPLAVFSGNPIELGHGGISSEPATTTGMTQQMMRHNEALMSASIAHMNNIMLRMSQMLDKVMEQNTKLVDENADVLSVAKELIMEKAANQHEHRMRELETERKNKEREKLFGYLPPLVNQLTGKEIFPASTVAQSLFDSLADSITPEQIAKLAEVLTPEQAAPVMDFLHKRWEANEKKKLEGNNGGST